jgi:hypothetical protein
VYPVGLEEMPHPKQIGARISAHAGMRSRDVGGQLIDHAFTPGRRFDLVTWDRLLSFAEL